MKSIALLVLNWNGVETTHEGKPLLDFCLPSFLAAVKQYPGNATVMLVDNNSTDSSVSYVEKGYPEVQIVRCQKNKYLFSYNDIVPNLSEDNIFLLNSDMAIAEDSLAKLAEGLEERESFSVGPDVFSWKNGVPSQEPDSRCLRLQYYRGRLYPVDVGGFIETQLPKPFYVLGGAIMFQREKFLAIGGLETLYTPYYFEDSDLAFRAHHRGWRVRIIEKARAYHLGSATLNATGNNPKSQCISLQNEHIFLWKNFKKKRYLLQNILWMPWNAFRYRYGGIFYYFQAVWKFMHRLPKVFRARKLLFKFPNAEDKTDRLFFNQDLKGDVKKYFWARVFIMANEPRKAIRIARNLFPAYQKQDGYLFRQVQKIVSDTFVVLYQRNRFGEVIAYFESLPKAIIDLQAKYIVASSYREKKKFQNAEKFYQEIAIDKKAEKKLRGLSYFHQASIFQKKGENDKVFNFGNRCLELFPDHQACQKLIKEIKVS